ncbi:MAG: hypothetical protein QXV17_11500 [Candidatus Micrarchaeaceae archaeon]
MTISGLFRFPYIAFPATFAVVEMATIFVRERKSSFDAERKRFRFPPIQISNFLRLPYVQLFVFLVRLVRSSRCSTELDSWKLNLFIVLGFAIYSKMIKTLRAFNKSGYVFIMLLIPWYLQRLKGLISLLFL